MEPVKFKESNRELKKPFSMTEEDCGSLHVHVNAGGESISCWNTSLWERIKFLFHGNLWLYVFMQGNQPPVALRCEKTAFQTVKK